MPLNNQWAVVGLIEVHLYVPAIQIDCSLQCIREDTLNKKESCQGWNPLKRLLHVLQGDSSLLKGWFFFLKHQLRLSKL